MKAESLRQPAHRVTAVVIGGGQAGLATSFELGKRGIDHVVLERGQVANSWRTERWDSLRLLTPNWQAQLPGYRYAGDDPDRFMSCRDLTDFISGYARSFDAPVRTRTRVTSVAPRDGGYRVETDRGTWHCATVVLASGPYNIPSIPAIASAVPECIAQLTPHGYRNPGQLTAGGVLVVGAAATGVQIAREIAQSGRRVTLAVGEHVRLPRRYRGRDIEYWSQELGLLDESYRDVDDLQRVRGLPSPQLIGHPDHIDVDLNALAQLGVAIVGRLVGIQGYTAQFSGGLANVVKLADLKQQRLLRSIDTWIEARGLDIPQEALPAPTRLGALPCLSRDLRAEGIETIIWATGFRPDYAWLDVPVLDRRGRLRHEGGVTPAPGLYAMGLPFMRRRKSASLFGAGDDARDIATHLAAHVRGSCRSRRVAVA